MVKLLIIADDFTGALDTGVQFAKRGIKTQVFTDTKLNKDTISQTAQVLVVDSETRPLSPQAAYRIVKGIAKEAARIGIQAILKKTDSALRGNVGAELQAVLDASEEKQLYFVPAFPDIGRITKKGIHYIDGELLENSPFGKDPFEPVRESYIPTLLGKQCDIHIKCVNTEEAFPEELNEEQTIFLFDAETKEQVVQRVHELKNHRKLTLMAGCAGFAEYLPEVLGLEEGEKQKIQKTHGLYIACGSLNPITKEQIDDAVLKGCVRVNLTPEQKLMREYYDESEGENFLNMLLHMSHNVPVMIVDTYDLREKNATLEYADGQGISREQIRYRISECHGKIIKNLVEQGMNSTILMTGGDTLMGFMKEIGCIQLSPICEIEKGAVLSSLSWDGKELQVISKSGGFGEKEIITNISEKVLER